MLTTSADEARVVEPHHDHDAVAHDPLVNRAQRNLTLQVAMIGVSAGPNRIGKTRAAGCNADTMPIADVETRGGFETLRSVADSGLARENQFDLIRNRRRDGKVETCVWRAVRTACEITFEHAVCFGSGI